MIPYSHNQEILEFFNKAQNKIAQLGSILADEDTDDIQQEILLGLSDVLESLDSPYLEWSEVYILRVIHYWNKRAGLNELPFIQMTNYTVYIKYGEGSTVFPDITNLINEALKKFPHNNLQGIQGGDKTSNQFYHLTKKQLDWLNCQMEQSPCPTFVPSVVTLDITPSIPAYPSGYYELGTTVPSVTLQGGIQLGMGDLTKSYHYQKDNNEIPDTKVLNTSVVQPYTDRTSIKKDTIYTFYTDFDLSGPKTASRSIQFRQPMYYGVLTRELISETTAIKGTKLVQDKQYVELTFDLPEGNTLLPYGKDKTAYLFIPQSWGIPSSMKVLDFEFKTDWTFENKKMKLQDGTLVDGILCIFKNQAELSTTFKVSF